jgi:hypothetical protein
MPQLLNDEQYNPTIEISISYISKTSSMFSKECVGGPWNGSQKLAWKP